MNDLPVYLTDYTPNNWMPMEEQDGVQLFLLDPLNENEEYEHVTSRFLLTLRNAKILRVERVQNRVLMRRYFEKSNRMKHLGIPDVQREELLFHGTGKEHIISKTKEGFSMQFFTEGMWGRGNYFAVNSSYSHEHAFKQEYSEIYKMFAVYVLIGNSCFLEQDSTLTNPPSPYDSVHGIDSGTHIYITYDNEHAYPSYLISYTL